MSLTELARKFDLPGLRFEQNKNGLVHAIIQNPIATGEVYFHGGHITAWQPQGHNPVLWVSRESAFEPEKAIRGGVPICFPWFGSHPTDNNAPAHGYARISDWQLAKAEQIDEDGIRLQLETYIDPFRLIFQVQFGHVLETILTTHLPAEEHSAHRFEDALHTYLSVSDVRSISISGLEQCQYVDKLDQSSVKQQSGSPIQFSSETDRVYYNNESSCVLTDPQMKRQISVSKSGSRSTVIWNPWIDKSIRMKDFGDDEWQNMVCIETANVGTDAIELSPGQSHSTSAVISVLPFF